MAEVIIDGARRRQIEGTSLADLQVAYPLCWLERDDGVEIRLPKYVLEKDRHYVLINNESSVSSNASSIKYFEVSTPRFLPLPISHCIWEINGLSYAGLGINDSISTYVRDESRDLWATLSELQVCYEPGCRGQCGTKRGVWVVGPPGVGKSTELYGWGMHMATRQDASRKDLLWLHLSEENYVVVVEVIRGVMYHSKFHASKMTSLEIVQLGQNCSLILLDAFRSTMKDLISCFRTELPEAIVVACTSYQSWGFNSEYWTSVHHFQLLDCVVYSWTWQQYIDAHQAGVFGSGVTLATLEELFYYAGGSVRSMFQKVEDTKAFLTQKLMTVTDYGLLLAGLTGEAAPTAVNSLVSVRPSSGSIRNCGLVSEYVVKFLSQVVSAEFTTTAKRLNVDNPVWQGWIFEMKFLRRLCELDGAGKELVLQRRDESGAYTDIVSIHVNSSHSQFDGQSIPVLVHQSVIIPTRWNQGCFDAVYYSVDEANVRHFLFINATIASEHNFDFKFIAQFLHLAVGTPAARRTSPTDIRVSMVVVVPDTRLFSRHSGVRNGVEAVQLYDPSFNGEIDVLTVPYDIAR